MKRLLAVLVFFPVVVGAQTSTVPQAPNPPSAPDQSAVFGSPCTYFGAASSVDLLNSSQFTYFVTGQGNIADVAILVRNGNDAIDAATIRCVSGWHVSAGSPSVAETVGPHWAVMDWRKDSVSSSGWALTGTFQARPGGCRPDYYPPQAIRLGEEGTTTVQFYVEPDGSVRSASVFLSSGYRDLDETAVACVKFLRYKPEAENGRPAEVLAKAAFKWALQ